MQCGLDGQSGVVGLDENDNKLKCIKFGRIKGGKPFDFKKVWFQKMLQEIGQL